MNDTLGKDKGQLTRRGFIKGAAVGAGAVAVAGIGIPKDADAAPIPKKWDMTADVIVVGTGPAGMPAAVAAVDKGASVIMLEQSKIVGGAGVINGGILNIGGGSRVEKLNGIKNSPDQLFERLSSYKDPYTKRNDLATLRVFCDQNPVIIEWLEQHGVRFHDTLIGAGGIDPLHPDVYHHVKWDKEHPGRLFKHVGSDTASGAGIIKPLEAYVRSKGAKILLEHKMTQVIRKGGTSGRVLGVEAQVGGKKVFLRAKKGVVLGCGGWKGNKFLRKLFDSRITEDIGTTGEPIVNSDGSGLLAAMAAGAVLASDRACDKALFRRQFGTRNYLIPPNSPYGSPGIDVVGPRWGDVVFVNKKGKRFVKEEDGFDFFNAAFAQEEHVLWAIFDDDAVKKNNWNMSHPNTQEGCAFSAPVLAELAKLIKVPGDALSEAVQKYNTYVDEGKDPDFDKPKRLLRAKIEKAPFYAASIRLFCHDTCGGLAINARSQVFDISGKVIPGLYAAGEAASGGIDIPGMPPALIFGKIAGENAAAESPA